MEEHFKHVPIQQWAEEDRPREKMLNKGRLALSDVELIAVLLGSGMANQSAVDLARQLLQRCHYNLDELGKLTINDLTKIKGIGPAKAVTLVSAFELGRRRTQVAKERVVLKAAEEVYVYMKPHLLDLPHEEFWVISLNRANVVIRANKISSGGIAGTVVDTRMLFKEALENLANSVILVHNHPSGTLKPSDADEHLTRKLVEAGKFLEIQVLDHLIFTDRGYYSFADHGTIL
ncbi:MAG TPA: DNA repair protein RadC [Cytophagaceae bacterium]|nr:DNA repair protein RadC [Cytophagaceae bacterium]